MFLVYRSWTSCHSAGLSWAILVCRKLVRFKSAPHVFIILGPLGHKPQGLGVILVWQSQESRWVRQTVQTHLSCCIMSANILLNVVGSWIRERNGRIRFEWNLGILSKYFHRISSSFTEVVLILCHIYANILSQIFLISFYTSFMTFWLWLFKKSFLWDLASWYQIWNIWCSL